MPTDVKMKLEITPMDAEMVVSWAEWARDQHPSNSVLRESISRFREAFSAAAMESLKQQSTRDTEKDDA